MPFWLHQPKFALIINGFSSKKKLLIIMSVCLSVLGAWYGFYIFHITMVLKQKEQKYNDLLRQRALFNKTSVRCDQAQLEHKQLSLQFNSITRTHASIQKTTAKLLSLMKKKGLLCHGIKPTAIKSKDLYEKHHFSLSGKGDFRSFLELLGDMAHMDNLMKIKSLVIKKDKHNGILFKAAIRFLQVG